jgi:creatinine amidohydrolase/Fe(II)-dependent formamide hydrolase-like protein
MLLEFNKYRYMYMRPPKIERVLKECPIALQPTGLLEWHGDQNPLGLDGLLSTYICERAIQKIGNGALLPTNWIGTYGFIRYPGTICFNHETTYNVFVQLFRELIKVGFRVIMILTGHWGADQEKMLKDAKLSIEKELKEFKGTKQEIRIFALRWCDFYIGGKAGGHAQEGETSMIWRMSEANGLNLVDLSEFRTGKENVPKYSSTPSSVDSHEPPMWGWPLNLKDPKLCSPKIGEEMIETVAEGIAEEMIDALNECGIKYKIT